MTLSVGQRVLAPCEVLFDAVIVRIDSGMVPMGGEVVYWVREVGPGGEILAGNSIPFRASQLRVADEVAR